MSHRFSLGTGSWKLHNVCSTYSAAHHLQNILPLAAKKFHTTSLYTKIAVYRLPIACVSLRHMCVCVCVCVCVQIVHVCVPCVSVSLHLCVSVCAFINWLADM